MFELIAEGKKRKEPTKEQDRIIIVSPAGVKEFYHVICAVEVVKKLKDNEIPPTYKRR